MFEFLNDKSTESVLAAVYFAARILTHRDSIDDYQKVLPVKGIEGEPTKQEAALGRAIIAAIVRREKKNDVRRLSAGKISKYLSDLNELADARLTADLGAAESIRGTQLLQQWRDRASRLSALARSG